MRSMWQLWFGTALGSAVFLSGCASSNLFGSRSVGLPIAQNSPSGSTLASNSSGNGPVTSAVGAESIPSDLYGKMPVQAAAAPANAGGVVLASLWQAGKSVSNALKIQSKVSPVVDPVKLDNQPANANQVAADLHYHAGYFFETQHKPIDAAGHYRDALQKSPQDVRAMAGYGRIQEQLGNIVEAEDYLKRACELAPQDAAPRNDLAQVYSRQKKLSAAVDLQRQAVALQPTNQLYRGSLAQLLVDTGKPDEAVQQIAAAHGEAAAHCEVGCLLQARGQTDLARQYLQRSLALNPSLAPARQMWDRLQVTAASIPSQQGPSAGASRLPNP